MSDQDQRPTVSPGVPDPRGVSISGDGINVAVFSAYAEAVDLCLFDETGEQEIARIRLPERTGDVFHGHIGNVPPGTRYGLRAHGPYEPHKGHRFNPAKLLVDPYALALDRPFGLAPTMFGFEPGAGAPSAGDSAADAPKGIVVATPPKVAAWSAAVPWESMVVSELHVRGLTMLHPGVPEHQRGTFAGLASPAVIAHFKQLGITTIELLPAAASLDERHLKPLGLSNYWNYNPVAYLAPDPRLAPGGWAEIRAATTALNAAGIEVILDVVYNHSGEGDAEGPTVSLRGLDNASYYRLDADDPARYVNDAGCGNILAADHPAVVHLVMTALRAWAEFGGFNGFRFDLATTLGRRRSGFESGASLLAAIEQDPVLQPLRLIAEPWDIGPGGYQLGSFGGRWGEWNDKYRDDVRRFWRGDGTIADLATRLAGSTDRFWYKRKPSRSINFVTAHDGFTLADLVSYAHKHNDANGESNRDGTDDNRSWNNGIEGPTDDPAILAQRARDQRNLLATVLLSRGTPMLGPGSETGQTQGGNNNAYAQDNAISWIAWAKADPDLLAFVSAAIAQRAANPALTHDRFLTGHDVEGLGAPDVVWRLADGRTPDGGQWTQPEQHTLVADMRAPSQSGQPNRVVAVFHAGQDAVSLTLPECAADRLWRVALDTHSAEQPSDRLYPGEAVLDVPARSVLLFVEATGTTVGGMRRAVAADVVDRLAQASGIAPAWFDIAGTRHEVTLETKRALLAAMGLGFASTGEARDRLSELASLRDRRLLPPFHSARTDEAVSLRVARDDDMMPDGVVSIIREDGSDVSVPLDLDHLQTRVELSCDGRPVRVLDLALPPQPAGRHRVRLGNIECALTVAPPRCYLPPDLAAGGRAFGVAAHVYQLRGASDAGIGDFSTLGDFAAAAGRHGAGLVGINPVHALFGNNRERASPYHPSDRRFLDPIYIDVGHPDVLGEAPEVQALYQAQAVQFAELRARPLVDYTGVWQAKKRVLEAAFAVFDARRGTTERDQQAFATFVAAGGEPLQRFATFEAISETITDRDWMGWPAGLRDPGSPDVGSFATAYADRVRFHLYLQWLAERHLTVAAEKGRANGLDIGLYRDLAVGTAPDGAEAWAEQLAYARGVSVGSPPDPFSATGQIWCLPPPNPIARLRSGGDPFGTLLHANMRHAGALRIDHAMGLSRLFWVPDGAPGSAGAYVANDFAANLAEVALESHRAACLVIGEDLGTVQDGFRETLERNDILSYRVLFFEREGTAFKPARSYPRRSVACVATHDLAPLAGWWRGADIDEREAVGQATPEASAVARRDRVGERVALARAVDEPALTELPEVPVVAVTSAVHAFMAEAPSMLVVAQADDLLGESLGVNLPGTDLERPNWRRRLPLESDALFDKAVADNTLPIRLAESGPTDDSVP